MRSGRKSTEKPDYSHICEYSHISNMPDNVHSSYLKLAKEACWYLLSDFNRASEYDHKQCITYLKKAQPPKDKLVAYVAGYIRSLPLSRQNRYCYQKDLDNEVKRLGELTAISAACKNLGIKSFKKEVFQPALQRCLDDTWLVWVNNDDELPPLEKSSYHRDKKYPRLYENSLLNQYEGLAKKFSAEEALAYISSTDRPFNKWWQDRTSNDAVGRMLCRFKYKCPPMLIHVDDTRYGKISLPKLGK